MDDQIRRYERELQKAGLDPREVAVRLLGHDASRFWLVFLYSGASGLPSVGQAEAPVDIFRVSILTSTVNYRNDRIIVYQRGWAAKVVALAQAVEWSRTFASVRIPSTIWDYELNDRIAFGDLTSAVGVERNWDKADSYAEDPSAVGP